MLQSLHIVNFAIIEDTVIDLTKGVTIFTGETGAGKSILIDALAVLTGRRAKTDLIRTGADFFKVEGIFYADDSIVSALQELGIECEGHEVILSRKLNKSGRGLCTINGDFCTVKQLQKIGKMLVRLHEQNDNMELLSIPFCEKMVDSGTSEVAAAYRDYQDSYREWKKGSTTCRCGYRETLAEQELLRRLAVAGDHRGPVPVRSPVWCRKRGASTWITAHRIFRRAVPWRASARFSPASAWSFLWPE